MPGSPFSFGINWKKYILKSYSEERLAVAQQFLLDFLQLPDLKDKTFLDIGCGSGIHSLAAWEAGAQRVMSIDIDADSVRAASILRKKRGNPENWEIRRGSILDDPPARDILPSDIVYSWGVLHHTGNLWQALGNGAKFLKPGSLYYIAIYEKTPDSDYWIGVKKKYNASGRLGRRIMEFKHVAKHYFFPPSPKRIVVALRTIATHKAKRGMSFMTDVRDWLGGWPYEPATEKEVCDFCENRLGLRRIRVKTGEANIEYLFLKPINNELRQ